MMSHMSTTTLALLVIASLSTNANASTAGKAFLKTSSHLKEERMSAEDVQENLLEEVETAFGKGSASSRLEQIKKELGPIYAALPKNENGHLGHATVRYALHRLFVQRHGWLIRGLYDAGGHRNSTESAGMLKEQVPAYIQDLFEKRLGGRGFGIDDLGVVAATIEHLIHNEATKRVGYAFQVHNLLPTSPLNESVGDEILDTYMTAYVLGEDLSKMKLEEVITTKEQMPNIYMAWNATRVFVRAVRGDVVRTESTLPSGDLDFTLVAHAAEKISEKFGGFQHHECAEMKASLVKIEEKGTGRVRLSDFYKPALDGQWQFMESAAYLRQLGALDETDPDKPRVIIVNYVSSPANCIASSNFYSVCCMAECEGLLGQLENHFAAPEATPDRIARRVSMLASSSVSTPRTLSDSLLSRLGEIAAENGGNVPLHGRLFSQWMHHAFPLECPYPHVSGTTNPQTSDEWLRATGEESTATTEEMQAHVTKANTLEVKLSDSIHVADVPELPWASEEELMVAREQEKAGGYSLLASVRNLVIFVAVVSMAFELVMGKQFSQELSTIAGMLVGKNDKCLV